MENPLKLVSRKDERAKYVVFLYFERIIFIIPKTLNEKFVIQIPTA